ncbi:DUF6678 family protein [Aquimarina spongiae]|uniref:Uncharacterized protein n=1 Tax=Aquimarina spongiae TaxID=570521 RepID=A0A1M6L936_9FLAO|nr:DUF6678 family protein [Aquimarina spongiae]SHJ67664.1 hypothetical protein SAMN04488508_11460 [Aquimarina spongiae]
MLEEISRLISEKRCRIRFNWFYDSGYEVSEWGSYLNFPTDDYFEPEHIGPIKINQWRWLEIHPFEEVVVGRLIPPKTIDYSLEIKDYLSSKGISFVEKEGLIKIDNPNFIRSV